MARPSNFSESQKAQIFVRDRAHCSYTARPLWLLDEGCSGLWMIDWADHILPVSRGGASEVSNGCCASAAVNFDKRDGEGPPRVLSGGHPTGDWRRLPPSVQRRARLSLRRFTQLHVSDWYFNRAVFRTFNGVRRLYGREAGWPHKTRDAGYFARAATEALKKWRRLAKDVSAFETRQLVTAQPTRDQHILLGLRDVKTAAEVRDAIDQLLPFYSRSVALLERLKRCAGRPERAALARSALRSDWPPGLAAHLRQITNGSRISA